MGQPPAVRVDPETYRLIGDLAHLMGSTRKDVVRDAVRALASLREVVLDDGLDRAADRLAIASARHRGRVPASASIRGTAPPTGSDAPVGSKTDAEWAGPNRIAAALEKPMVLSRLSPAERLEAQRAELELAFAEDGAHRPRLVDSVAYGYLPEHVVIGVELAPGAQEWPLFATLGAKSMAIAGINAYFVRVDAS